MKNNTKCLLLLCIIFFLSGKSIVNAQLRIPELNPNAAPVKINPDGAEQIGELLAGGIKQAQQQVNASDADFRVFRNFYSARIDSAYRKLFRLVHFGKINHTNVNYYVDSIKQNLAALYSKFLDVKRDYASSVAQYADQYPGPLSPLPLNTVAIAPACNTTCTNMDFSDKNLTGWYGYYGANIDIGTISPPPAGPTIDIYGGGALTGLTKGALTTYSPTTYQVHLTSGANNDNFLKGYGVNMSQASPWGSGYAAMIGDSIAVGVSSSYGVVGVLTQKFTVTPTTNSFTYAYAVFLDNPFSSATDAHLPYQQPFFSVVVLDKNGDTIPTCGKYNVLSSQGIANGFKVEIYNNPLTLDNDSVFYKEWTEVNVPLKKYVGQCVTIIFEASDCSLGGHFGYAYVDASCAQLAITSSSDVMCANSSVTLYGPPGESAYQWISPPGNSITTSKTLQNVTADSAGTYTLVLTPADGALCKDTIYYTITEDKLKATVTGTNISCNGGTNGTATGTGAIVTGGTLPFTYSWSPSGGTNTVATGLAAGTYTFTVKDANGCSATASIVLTQPTTIGTTTSFTPASCNLNNGSATVNVTGGTSPYTYSWNPSGETTPTTTGIPIGTYTVLVTDNNGCTKTTSVTVTEPSAIKVTIATTTGVSCSGGSNGAITTNTTGGSVPYTYSWNPTGQTTANLGGLSAGTYTVTATDKNGCVSTATATIAQPTPVVVNTTMTQATCGSNNGSATATASGGTPGYNYSWNPGGGNTATINNLSAGTYTCTVTDKNNCVGTSIIVVTNIGGAVVSITASTNELCFGGTIGTATSTVTGGVAPYTYTWSPSGGNGATATGLSAGTYNISVKDANGCTSAATVTITQPTAITSTTSFTPASCNLSNGSATVNAANGTPPYKYSWNPSGQSTATATGIPIGKYTVTITDNNGCTETNSVTVTEPSAVTAIISGTTPVSCFGGNNGTATATATGGSSPYTYSWSLIGGNTNVATGLPAGTYTVTVKDVSGCVSTTTAVIIQPTLLSATMGAPIGVLCNGGNNGSATVTVTGGTAPYTYTWTPIASATATDNGLTAGTYTVNIVDKNGCTTSSTVLITQPTPVTETTVMTQATCGASNGTATATANGGTPPYTYSWAPVAGNKATLTGIPAGTYTCTVTDKNSCTTTSVIIVTNVGGPGVSITAFTNELCNGGNNGSATATVTGGNLPYTYTWTPSGGNNAIANGLTIGTYTITVKDANGCTIATNVTITQPPLLKATTGVPVNVSCNAGNNGSVSVTATGGTPPYTYLWNPSGQKTTDASNLVAGTYTVTVTDNNGCTTTSSAIITQPPLLTVTIPTTVNELCFGDNNGSATSAVTGGTSPYQYTWSPIGGTNAIGKGLTAGNYTVTVTDAHGCVATSTTVINQPLALVTSTSFIAAYCNLPNGSATVNVTNGTPPYTYFWNPSSETTPTATGLAIGTYTVGVIDNNGCTTSNTVTVTEPSAVTVGISGTTPVSCFGGNDGTASALANGGTAPYTFLWEPGGNTNQVATGLDATTYTVIAKDASGCTTSAVAIITQPPLLTVGITGPLYLCSGATGTLIATPTGGTAPYAYAWSPGITSTTNTASVTPAVATTYTVIITDANQCKATNVFTVSIGSLLSVSTTGSTSVCQGTSAIICANASMGTGGNMFTWQPGNYTSPCITVTPSVTTTYTVTVVDNCGTTASATATIQVNPLPFVDFAADLYTGCIPLCIQFYNNSSVSGQSAYSWSFGNGDTALKTNHPIYCYKDSGQYTVTLTVTSDSGCTATRRKIRLIHALGLPKAAFTFTPQPAYILSPTIGFTDQTTDPNGGLTYWTWTYGDKLDSVGTTQNTIHTYQDTGTYCAKLAVMDHKGCTDTVTNCLIIDPIFTLYIPNAFTPNADGMDDIFMAKGSYVKDFEMYIFDRWGEQLFHSTDINKGWNGTVKGGTTVSQEDVYVYKILATDWQNHQHSYIGSVTLLK